MTCTRLRLIGGVFALMTVSATVVAAQQASSPLADVGQLMVGNWTGSGVYAADYPGVGKKGEKFTATAACRWAAGRAAIACEGKDNESTWSSMYWYDVTAKVVRFAAVNSGGNFDQGTTAKVGAKLVSASAGSFGDGRKVEYKWETLFEDNGNTRIEAGATILNGVRNEYRDTYKRVKK